MKRIGLLGGSFNPAHRGHRGISLLVVERGTPGFEVSRRLDKMGWRSSDTAELSFTDARVPADNMVGDTESGFVQIALAFVTERIALAAQGLAVLIYVAAMIDLQRLVAANITYQVWLLVMLLLHVLIRFERVRHGMRDPERTTTGSLPRQRRRR